MIKRYQVGAIVVLIVMMIIFITWWSGKCQVKTDSAVSGSLILGGIGFVALCSFLMLRILEALKVDDESKMKMLIHEKYQREKLLTHN